ncbi:PspA/IM30 family protein [Agaribacterium sp. ZY112]|uniref:PspA/IM30 family protein n=1 Tax=Agaribacterium sp. ZY112 TaxID=3233574 RepID=UPI0035237C97
MNILKKLLTALRGGAREAGEAVIDANAMRIYEQEIVDARNHIGQAKESLTTVMAQDMQVKRELEALTSEIAKHEVYATEALNKGNEALALEVAEKIAKLENELKQLSERKDELVKQIDSLKTQIRNGEKTIAEHERQLAMVKTTDSVQKATIAISENIAANNSQLNSAKDSLERIRKRQQETSDKLVAGAELAEENSDAGLKQKLQEAGIVEENTGAAVLARLKAKS